MSHFLLCWRSLGTIAIYYLGTLGVVAVRRPHNTSSVCFFDITLLLYCYLTFPQFGRENICFFTHLTFLYRLPLFLSPYPNYLTFALLCMEIYIFSKFVYF